MKRWTLNVTLATILLAMGLGEAIAAEAKASGKPNFILILTDDQGWSQLSSRIDPSCPESQSDYLETPNMARLAKSGVRFTSGYSPAPICTPTRRSIQCGMTCARQRGTEFSSEFDPADHLTIPKTLRRADPDYRCAHFGKWGSQMVASPTECGYDASDGMTSNHTGNMPIRIEERFKVYTSDDPKKAFSITDRAVSFMRKQSESGHPFYVQLSHYAVHLAIEAREDTIQAIHEKGEPDRRYTPAFAAMLYNLDSSIGRLLDVLEETGLREKTYIFFMSDNGGRGTIPGGDQSRLPTNHPLSGSKQSLREGGIRVPFIAVGPGVEAGAICHEPVAGYDLLPTFYDLAGGEQPLPSQIDGGSLREVLLGGGNGTVERSPIDGLVFHRPKNEVSVLRRGDYKLMIEWTKDDRIESLELFDLAKDISESNDLSDQEPERTEQMKRDLLTYLESVDARFPSEIDE